ncbi:MAG: Fe3+-dicitrate receptor [Acidobacteria bacterium RIFCSPLOWO2_12_FULL_65_11]|nr:MAG: Fe3+-dicitrate receptor [Acidobacteria bacterium RIFCSPLOWO2_12_FULL_65_11]
MRRFGLWPIVVAVLVTLFSAHAGLAQSRSAALSGDVVDQTGAAIAHAAVVIRRDSTGFEQKLDTDAQGSFGVSDLPPGEYEASATGLGFTVAVQRVSLGVGETRRLRFTLLVGGLTEDVTVLGQEVAGSHDRLLRLPGSVDVVERETLDASHVLTTNEALRKVAGLHLRDEEGLGLRPNIGIRGLNPTRSNKVLLLEDGIPLTYAPYGDNATYYHPPIERFGRIEVLKGGAQIAYGPQTVGGLINYITPMPPVRSAGSITLLGGNRSYFNGRVNYGNTVGSTGYLFDYMRKQGDGARENVNSKLNDVNLKVVRTLSPKQTWTFRGNYYSEDSNITYSGLHESEYLANPRGNPFENDFFYIDRYGTSATNAYTLNGNLALATNVYFTSFRRHWWRQSSNSSQRPNDSADPACGGMANLSTTCGIEGRLRQYYTGGVEPRLRAHHQAFGIPGEAEVGARVHFERQDRRQENGDSPTARSGVIIEDNLRYTQAYSTFVQDSLLVQGWTITPGFRVEHVRHERTNRLANSGAGVTGDTSLTQFVPGIGASHTRGEWLTIFGGVHRGFAPPRTEDVITNQGGVVELDPELSWNYEVGVRSTLRPGARLDATFFRMDFENQIVPASVAGGVGATLTNGGSTLHQGLELAGRLDSAPLFDSTHNAYFRAAVTYVPTARFTGVRSSGVSGFNNVSITGNRLPYAPEWLTTAGLGYTHRSGVDALLEAVYAGDQFGDDLNTVTGTADGQRGLIPGYVVWNTAVNHTVGRTTLFVTVKNVFDRMYIVDRTRGLLPGSPRLVQAGVTLKF